MHPRPSKRRKILAFVHPRHSKHRKILGKRIPSARAIAAYDFKTFKGLEDFQGALRLSRDFKTFKGLLRVLVSPRKNAQK